jgi:hypothetical protein
MLHTRIGIRDAIGNLWADMLIFGDIKILNFSNKSLAELEIGN